MKFILFICLIGGGIVSLSYGTHLQDPFAYDWNLWQYAGVGCLGCAIIVWGDLNR